MGTGNFKLTRNDRDKISFISHHGLGRFVFMSLRLWKAPGKFRRTMKMIVLQSSVKIQMALVCIDDIFNFPKLSQQPIGYEGKILCLYKIVSVTVKLKKCRFFKKTISYFDRNIRSRRLDRALHATDAIIRLLASTNFRELRSSLDCLMYSGNLSETLWD